MTRPTDISQDIWERADILRDQFQDVKDDTEFVARILMAVGQGPEPHTLGLTRVQQKTLTFISEFQQQNSVSPSYEEIAKGCGHASKGVVHSVLHRMKERGAIQMAPNRARSITIVARA